jgi:membrane protein YdbS with pleckstrin-like domain
LSLATGSPERVFIRGTNAAGPQHAFKRNEVSKQMGLIADFLFLILFVIFLVGWLLVWAVFHLAGGGIHILLALAIIWLIIHLFRRRRAV